MIKKEIDNNNYSPAYKAQVIYVVTIVEGGEFQVLHCLRNYEMANRIKDDRGNIEIWECSIDDVIKNGKIYIKEQRAILDKLEKEL